MRFGRLLFTLLTLALYVRPGAAEPLLVISIDGLHPNYVLEADKHGLSIPALRSFVRDGAYAAGVVGVVPTVTFPSHTTLVTGTSPATHGIQSNTTFDPLNRNAEGWYWYAEDVRGETLWDAAAAKKLSTASVNWSVTVGNRNIDYLIPELWRARTNDDLKLLRAAARPEGMLEELEVELGPFVNGYEDTVGDDVIRTKFAVEILRRYQPELMAVHLIALDGVEHRDGPFVPSAFAALEALDTMIGDLAAAALENDPDTVVAIVSDHGFIATHTAVNLRVPFVAAGLITLAAPPAVGTAPGIAGWDAQFWPSAASAAVVLRNRNDTALRARVQRLLTELAADAANGIARVVTAPELAATGGFPEAEFIVEFRPGFYFGSALHGPVVTPGTSRGTHGYWPDRPEMHAAFFAKGRSVAQRRLGVIDMRQIAPTLAEILGVTLRDAEAAAVAIRRGRNTLSRAD
jgi:predicted AlkP superfamily pyrophosphatase or phosphodiesterase